jgi:hypothetical protein
VPLGYEQLFKQCLYWHHSPKYGLSQMHLLTGYAISHHPCVLQLFGQSSVAKREEREEREKNKDQRNIFNIVRIQEQSNRNSPITIQWYNERNEKIYKHVLSEQSMPKYGGRH